MSSIISNNNNKREIAPETKQDTKKVKTSRKVSDLFRASAFKIDKNPFRLNFSPLGFDDEIDSDDELGTPTGFRLPFEITKPAVEPAAPPPPPPPVKMGHYVPEYLKYAIKPAAPMSDAQAGYKQYHVVWVPKYPEKYNPTAPIYSASQMPEMVAMTVRKFPSSF
ncbi:hypothetical protein N9S30_00270 [bacterium]|nr:hypothetical protein [bacterium]